MRNDIHAHISMGYLVNLEKGKLYLKGCILVLSIEVW